MKRTAAALAHPNIAFIKYWGNRDNALRLPANGSVSMNLGALATKTTVTFRGGSDTLVMHRWIAKGGRQRVEVWNSEGQTVGYCTNGSSRFRQFSRQLGWWQDREEAEFAKSVQPYELRGQLYGWRDRGIALKYNGLSEYNGQRMHVVLATQLGHYDRYYFFEERSGLLVLVREMESSSDGTVKNPGDVMEWKIIHEYRPVGGSLVVSQESFMRSGVMTIMTTEASFEPLNDLVFNADLR